MKINGASSLPAASTYATASFTVQPAEEPIRLTATQGFVAIYLLIVVAMLLRYSLNEDAKADMIERAVTTVLDQGLRTADIHTEDMNRVSTAEMGDAVVAALG